VGAGSGRGHAPLAFALRLALGLMLLTLLAAAPAGAEPGFEYGEVTRFGGFDSSAFNGGSYGGTPTPGRFLDPTGFAVDPVDNTVYVVDRTSRDFHNPTSWRIQQFSPTGVLEGATMFTLPNNNFAAYAIEGLAVDHRSGRLYALIVGSPPATDFVPVAQEVLAWSTKPVAGGLVAATVVGGGQLPPDPLASEAVGSPGTVGGLVSSKAQLLAKNPPLYDPQGIAVDPLEVPGVDNPVAIEASDLANPPGNTIVQQVATQPQGATTTGDLLLSWSGASVLGQLEGSWGPLGISASPDGTLTVLLQASGATVTDVYVVKLKADLSEAMALDSPANVPPGGDSDESPMFTDSPPFATPAGVGVSDLGGAGPQVVRLSAAVPGSTAGPYAGVVFSGQPADYQVGPNVPPGPEYWIPGEEITENFEANIGVRLLESGRGEEAISDLRGRTIVNTLGNGAKGGPCNIGASEAALAEGAGGTLWIIDRGPKSDKPEASGQGREVIELAPGASQKPCPQPSGTFTMTPAAGAKKTGEETLEVPAGTPVTFSASSVNRQGGKPFAYEWDLDGSTTGGPAHDGFDKVYEMTAPKYYYPPSSITYTYTRTGEYKVRFRMRTDYGVYTPPHSGTVVVTKALAQPEANFTAMPAGQQVTFNASGSKPGVGTIVNYHWNWGDGSEEDESAQTPVLAHTYAEPGSYQVTLTVTNSSYQSVISAPQTVTVVAPAPVQPAASLSGPLYDIPAPFAPYPIPPGPRVDRAPTRLAPRARWAGGTLSVALSCPAAKKLCVGTVNIETAAVIVASKAGRGRHRASRLLLAHVGFDIPGGHSRTVKARLSARGMALLKSSKRLKVLVTVSAHDSLGDPGATTLRFTLDAPPARRSSRGAAHSRR
jgi:PKD repeat protein